MFRFRVVAQGSRLEQEARGNLLIETIARRNQSPPKSFP